MRKEIILILLFLILNSLFIIPNQVSASTTLYFGSIEKTYDDSGAVTEEKVYYPAGNSTVVKSTDYGLQTTDSLSFLHSDHLGSIVLVTDNSGNITDTMVYYSYGNIQSQNSNIKSQNQNSNFKTKSDLVKTDKLYTSQRLDSSTNLYYYNARYYNPTIGRFISADKAEGPNRYAYVGNNPVMRNDPLGLMQAEDDNYTDNPIDGMLKYLSTQYGLIFDDQNTFLWNPYELDYLKFAAERMTQVSDNPSLLSGIQVFRTKDTTYGGKSDPDNRVIRMSDGAFGTDIINWSRLAFIHEFSHVLDPGFSDSTKWDEFAQILSDTGIEYRTKKYISKKNIPDPDDLPDWEYRFDYFTGTGHLNKMISIPSDIALKNIIEGYAEFSTAYFAPELFEFHVTTAARSVRYPIDMDEYKRTFRSVNDYLFMNYHSYPRIP